MAAKLSIRGIGSSYLGTPRSSPVEPRPPRRARPHGGGARSAGARLAHPCEGSPLGARSVRRCRRAASAGGGAPANRLTPRLGP